MKQTVFAVVTLMAVITAAFFQDAAVGGMTDEIIVTLDACEAFASSGDWEKAEDKILDALNIWENKKGYISLTLRKDTAGQVSVSLERMLQNILSQNRDSLGESYGEAVTLIEGLRDRERIGTMDIF